MDGLKAFTYICDNVPEWKERLKNLAYTVNERHLEFTRLSRIAAGASSLRRQRTGSTESLRPEDEVPTPDAQPDPAELSPQSARVEIDPDAKRLFQEYRLRAKRKRANGSVASNLSGRPRSRMSLIVYYDSAIQDNFETMVRSIAGARNTLRKGKTAASMKSRMAGMVMDENPFEGSRTTFSMREPKMPRLARSTQAGGAYAAEPFEHIDRELETAQTLCEIGAHQFLRDGTCQHELAGAQERIDSILPIAQEQRTLYEQEAKEEAAVTAQQEPSGEHSKQPLSYGRLKVDGMTHVDSDLLTSIAIDNTWAGGVSHTSGPYPAMDESIAISPNVAVDPAVAAYAQIAIDPGFVNGAGIAVDPCLAVDPAVAVDPVVAVDESITIEPDVMVDSGIAIDRLVDKEALPIRKDTVAVDSAHMEKIDNIAVDPAATHVDVGHDFKSHGPFAIAVDDNPDESFEIDLSAFRRTRRTYM